MKRKTFEQKREEVKQLTETMNQSIESYFETPEQMAEHLAFMMQFYQYSLRNTALIQNQFRGARAVGSYKFWQEKGFQVQKGEKAIQILVPNKTQPKFKDENGKWKSIKKATEQDKELIKKGDLEKNKSELYFARGSVFDVSQTDAKANNLPDNFPNRWLEGDVANYQDMLEAMKKVGNNLNVTIGEPLEELGAAKGVFYQGVDGRNNHIGLNPRNGELQNVKTLIHELAHAKLHSTPEKHFSLSSEEKEFQAEMTAYAVASYFGIDTSDYSLGYLANWTQGKELNDKAKLLQEVRETAVEFIEIMEPELIKEQEKKINGEKDRVVDMIVNERYLLIEYDRLNQTNNMFVSKNKVHEFVVDKLEALAEEKWRNLYYDGKITNVDSLKNEELKDKEYIEKFNHVFRETHALVDMDTLKEPAILIKWSENNRFEPNQLLSYIEANNLVERLSVNNGGEHRYDKTRYNIIFPKELRDEKGNVVLNMDRLDIGDGHYINIHHQVRTEAKIYMSENQWQELEEVITNDLIRKETKEVNEWAKKNRKKIESEMEM
ncbi:LPD25 domain-containing protein [Oceanobacillus sp. CF4.6]|uniref:LPD25 domain-containing protein n=1 Tax=Oceanobacillus sp. CF4.6 TaxID=3373080 RepID=UPI003EE4B6F0